MERNLHISELSVGDWVMVKGKTVKVQALGKLSNYVELEGDLALYHIKVVQPIPITPEILEKNRFVERKGDYMATQKDTLIHIEIHGVKYELEASVDDHIILACDVHCVHELQHALRLVRIDNEIEL